MTDEHKRPTVPAMKHHRELSTQPASSEEAKAKQENEAEALASWVLESSSDCIQVLDLDARLRYLNPAGLRLLELTEDGWRGRRWLDFWDAGAADAAVERARSGSVGRFNGSCTIPGGRLRWWDVVVSPIFGVDGTVGQLLAVARDATDQHRLEARLRAVIEAEPECVKLVARDGTLLEMNGAGLAMVEAETAGDVVGKQVFALVAPKDQAAFRSMHARVCDGGSETLEFEIVGLHGSRRRMETHAVPLRIEGHQGFVHLAITRDVTRGREAEEALRESEARLRMALDAARMGTWDWNIKTRELRWSELVGPLLGTTEPLLTPTFEAYRALIHPADRAQVEEAVGAALLGAVTNYAIEHRALALDGSVRWVEAKGRVVRDAEGTALRMAGTVTDITERKRAEATLHATEERLRQSQKMEAIGRLAGGIAHDFNNLLTAIGGFSELALYRLEADSPVRSDIAEIQRASEQAATLTRQLLAFSRKQTLSPKVINLNVVVGGIEGLLRRLIGENIDMVCSFTPELGAVHADPSQLEQVIMNLAVNARDAMPHGGRLSIKTSNVDLDDCAARRSVGVRSGRYVLLTVSDNGEGMDAETQANIFEPFFTTKPPGKGTGLGLATVYGILQQSEGHIWVDSEPGRGSTFEVYLPRADHGLPGAHTPLRDERKREDGNETILLVEDNEGVRKLARETLESHGYRVLVAINGTDALDLEGHYVGRIDLLLTDVVMPGMGGRELAARLLPTRPSMQVLFMSGYTDDAVENSGAPGSLTPLLQKPFTPGSLAAKVRSTLDATARGSLSAPPS